MPKRQVSGPHKEYADMDATSTVETVETSDSGLTPSTILKGCGNAQNGVSVENVYAPKDGYQWYVFRANYGRDDKANQLLNELGIETYVPRHTVYFRTSTGVKSTVRKMMPYFVLAYLTGYEARLFTKGPEENDKHFSVRNEQEKAKIRYLNDLLSFYYDHCQTLEYDERKNPPLTIPLKEMNNFIITTLTEEDVIPVEPETFEIGEEVEVIQGQFKGLIGKVMRNERRKKRLYVQLTKNGVLIPPPSRIREGKRRLLIQVPCLGSFGSAYIPTSYFRKVESNGN